MNYIRFYALCLPLILNFASIYSLPWNKPDHNYNAPLPNDIKSLLDRHQEDLKELPPAEKQPFPWLAGWVVKRGNDRIEGAKQFVAAIKNCTECHSFEVPKKYLYCAPHGQHYTISEYIEPSDKPITLQDIKELRKFANELGWRDCHAGNFRKTKTGTIALIDTKTTHIHYLHHNNDELNNYYFKFTVVCKLSKYMGNLTPEAKHYLASKHTRYLQHHVPEKMVAVKQQKAWSKLIKRFTTNFFKETNIFS